MAQSNSSPSQKLLDPIYSLKETIFPEFGSDKDDKAERIKKLMQKIEEEGPIKIKPVGQGQRGS